MRRALLTALAGGLVAAVLVGLPGAGSTLAQAAHPMPAGTGTQAKAQPGATEPELVLAPQTPVLTTTAESYSFTVLLRNPGDTPLPGGMLQLRLRSERLSTADELDAVEESGAARSTAIGERGMLLTEVAAAETKAGGDQTLTLTVPRASMTLGLGSDAGVYAVRGELVEGEEGSEESSIALAADPVLVGTSTIVWRGAHGADRLPLTVIVPLVLPGSVVGMPSQGDLADAAPRFDRLLEAAERWDATLAVDPRIVAGIRAYGDAAPAPARDFLDRLELSTAPLFMLQFADADPAAEAALGLTELMQPSGLSYITSEGSFPAPEPDPANPDADEEQPVPPSLEELLAWPSGTAGAWPAPGQVDADALKLLRSAGVGSLVLESGNVVGQRSGRAEIDGFDALVSDAGLDDAARRALGTENETERAAGSAALAARLALGAEGPRPAGMVLALDRGTVADASDPAALFDFLDGLAWLAPTPAAAQTSGTARLSDGGTAKDRAALLRDATKRSTRIDALAPLLERPWYLKEYQRVRLLQAFATRYAAPEADLAALSDRLEEEDTALLAGVQIRPSENTQLVGSSSRVPVLIHNSLPFPALVTLRVSPTSAAIRVPERRFEEQKVAAGANSTVLVPVESRVSSGDSALAVKVADSVDDRVFSEALLRLTLRSAYEKILLAVLGTLAALLFGFGVWRSVRRHRQRDVSESETRGRAE